MKLLIPEYYEKFRCVAGACPDSCCHQWAVDVDPAAAEAYRKLPGDLGDRLRKVLVDTGSGTQMQLLEGRCPMWRTDGLCRIQAELGHEALCQTCRDFPRLRHDYGDFVELGLELSCPEAARLILREDADAVAERLVSGGEAPEYDPEAMEILRQSRQELLAFMDQKTHSMADTVSVLLLYGYQVQAWLDGAEPVALNPEDCLRSAWEFAGEGSLKKLFDFFQTLEILTPQWAQKLNTAPVEKPMEESFRPLLRYGIRRWWYQAVSDYDLVGRVKFLVVFCLMVNALEGELLQNAQLFSKEIENDPDNVEAILDGAYTHPALTDRALLGLLKNCSKK